MRYPTEKEIARFRTLYPEGTRIELYNTSDPFTRLMPGDRGTVMFIDSIGTVHVKWDNGSTLGMIPGEDSFRRVDDEV